MTTTVNLQRVTFFSDLDLTNQTFTPVGTTVDKSGSSIVGGTQVASIITCALGVVNKAYMANEAAIASQLTQIQTQNVESKQAAAVASRLNGVFVTPAQNADSSAVRGAIKVALGLNAYTTPNSVADSYVKKITGIDISEKTTFTAADIENYLNKFAQFQQNAATQNIVLQEQMVTYTNHRGALSTLMTNILSAWEKLIEKLERGLA